MTAGGLIFAATASDHKIRAYDEDTGKVLWEYETPTGSDGVPAVYEVGGREYIAFCVAGGDGLNLGGAPAQSAGGSSAQCLYGFRATQSVGPGSPARSPLQIHRSGENRFRPFGDFCEIGRTQDLPTLHVEQKLRIRRDAGIRIGFLAVVENAKLG